MIIIYCFVDAKSCIHGECSTFDSDCIAHLFGGDNLSEKVEELLDNSLDKGWMNLNQINE